MVARSQSVPSFQWQQDLAMSQSGDRVDAASSALEYQSSEGAETVFDLLYDEYLPFRLYTEFMLGASAPELAGRYSVSELWVMERIEALRLCMTKQVRLNLLANTGAIKKQSNPLPLRARTAHQ
jgi:hypothetical protein